jgi:hypothetical protein
VSNDTHSFHAAWPEFWMSDLPVPAPFPHLGFGAVPQNGFGVRFAASIGAGSQGGCPNPTNLDHRRWTVDSAAVARNYVLEDTTDGGTALTVNVLDCVIAPDDNSGMLNHIELLISQNQIDVYATDAGVVASPTTLRKIATITNANLTLLLSLVVWSGSKTRTTMLTKKTLLHRWSILLCGTI